MVEKILELISVATDEQTLLLVQKFTASAGIFVSANKLVYLQRTEERNSSTLDTEMLSFTSSVLVSSVANDASFQSGQYSAITYKGQPETDRIASFALLTESYAKSDLCMDLEKFFYSLIDLFQLPQDQKTKNLVGFWGELKFIEHIWSNFGIDVAIKWHTAGTMSKYDFILPKANLEIKTTVGLNLLVPIKHSQLFGDVKNYLIVMSCEFDNSGETLNELIDKLLLLKPFKNNVQLQIKLLKERARISEREASEMKLVLRDCLSFKASALKTIENIPATISQVAYNYDFNGVAPLMLNSLLLSEWF